MNPLPVFGICGYSGSGKTTLIVELIQRLHSEAFTLTPRNESERVSAGGPARRLVPRSYLSEGGSPWSEGGLARRLVPRSYLSEGGSPWSEGGLKVGVTKHDVHGLNIDHEGKDSDRFFKAGADVLMRGPDQIFLRVRPREAIDLETALNLFCPHYDLVLFEGHKSTPFIDKVWLLKDDQETCPPDAVNVRRVLRRDEDRAGIVMEMLRTWLTEKWLSTPMYAGVLIGGESLQMGRPKHLITTSAGQTWAEMIVASVQSLVKQVAILGKGAIPKPIRRLPVLPDIEDTQGPLAGILSAMRWRPDVSWLFLSCDMPRITTDAARLLLANRKPGVWAVMPRRTESEGVEPLPGWYDFRSQRLLETCRGPAGLAGHAKVATPLIPEEFAAAWTHVNTVSERDAVITTNRRTTK